MEEITNKYEQLCATEILKMILKQNPNLITIDNDTALKMKSYYPTWNELINTNVKAGMKLIYKDKLYKVRQDHMIQDNWLPNEVASLYEVINESYEGTKNEPIPYDSNMAVIKSKYYIYHSILYLCIENSINPLYAYPDKSDLTRYLKKEN